MAQIGQQAFCATGRTCSKHEPHSDKASDMDAMDRSFCDTKLSDTLYLVGPNLLQPCQTPGSGVQECWEL